MKEEAVREGDTLVVRPARMPAKRKDVTEIRPQELMKLAIERGEAGVEMLEKLINLQERVSKEEARKEWHAAVVRFQRSCPVIPRTKKGRFGMYAPLGATMPLVRPFLAAEGLSATWTTQIESPHPYKICNLAHELGHVEKAACPIITDEFAGQTSDGKETLNAMQKYGIADSYAERYSFEAVAGLVSSEASDTDGGSNVNQPRAPSKPAPRKPATRKPAARSEEPPHTAEAPQTAPQKTEPAEQHVVIVRAESTVERTGGPNDNPWKKVTLKAADGNEYTTFSESFSIILNAACPTEDHAGEWLEIAWKKGRYGRDIVQINPTEGPPE